MHSLRKHYTGVPPVLSPDAWSALATVLQQPGQGQQRVPEVGNQCMCYIRCRGALASQRRQQCSGSRQAEGAGASAGKAGAPQPCPLAALCSALCTSGRYSLGLSGTHLQLSVMGCFASLVQTEKTNGMIS